MQGQEVQAEPEEQSPTPRVFEFLVKTENGVKVIERAGFLVATTSFIGLAVDGGEIVVLVPMDNIVYVNEKPRPVVSHLAGNA